MSRRSIRNFKEEEIDKNIAIKILECARWAPSGLNNQPWKVNVVVHPTIKRLLADCTKYGQIIENASINFVVFLDLNKSYNRVKDIQGIGAFMHNILLCSHALGLGSVWLGEILNKKEAVNEIFKLESKIYELMGVIALGIIDDSQKSGNKDRERQPIDAFTEFY
ncbi:MAG: nitroreductase [Promethearchaeota archaeon]